MARTTYDLWIDISNTPQVHVVRAIVNGLGEYSVYVTGFKRGETAELMKMFGLEGKVFGKDRHSSLGRSFAFASRTIRLLFQSPWARALLSFENAMPIPAAKVRGMRIILMMDNDLKFIGKKPIFQKIESGIKRMSTYALVPEVAGDVFRGHFSNIITYPGYKEHIYIADFEPDPDFLSQVPFNEYVVLRPESLTSLYVMHDKSIVPGLLRLLERENINVIYLPRDHSERKLASGAKNVYIPPNALDGLNLVYHSMATLTGSGTMAREAAVMGVPAVSFFPGERLLAVDRDLVDKGKMFHSREPAEIVEYVLGNWGKRREISFKEAERVKQQVTNQIKAAIGD